MREALRRAGWRALDVAVHSSVWVAAAAAALTASASLALGAPPRLDLLLLAFAGTLVVYNVDRLRDLPRDRETTPRRSAFVARHARALAVLAGAAGAVALAAALHAGPGVVALAAAVAALGLAHRRLKRVPFGKASYISLAWTAVVVGMPLATGAPAREAAPVALPLFLALFANAIASSVRDVEGAARRLGPLRALRISRCMAALGLAVCLVPGAAPAGLAPVPLLTWLALLGFQPGERFGLVVLDGALWLGALLAIPLLPRPLP